MSEYTAELREYFEQFAGESTKHSEIIETGRTKLFDFQYPIFDAAYKNVFETHFIRKFYMREIGFETIGLFKFQLETWLLINMPYFNKIFESELLQYDPLTNAKTDVTYNKSNHKNKNDTKNLNNTKAGTMTGTNTSINDQTTNATANENTTVNDDNFNRQLESNNPDSRLTITTNDGQGVIEYASNIKENNENISKTGTGKTITEAIDHAAGEQTSSVNSTETDTETGTVNTTVDDVEKFIQNRVGKIGVQSYPKMIAEYRLSLLRVEKSIFDEMNQLFMLVY